MGTLTVAALDAIADEHGVESYPKSGTKAEKLAALAEAGVELTSGDDEPGDGEYPTRHAANVAYFALPLDERADVQVVPNADGDGFTIAARGK